MNDLRLRIKLEGKESSNNDLMEGLDNISMEDLLLDSEEYSIPKLGTAITGNVVHVKKNQIVVDINGTEVGIRAGSFDTQDTWILHGSSWKGFDIAANASIM